MSLLDTFRKMIEAEPPPAVLRRSMLGEVPEVFDREFVRKAVKIAILQGCREGKHAADVADDVLGDLDACGFIITRKHETTRLYPVEPCGKCGRNRQAESAT